MTAISSNDRIVLLALEKVSAGLTETGIAIATGIEFEDVKSSILRMEFTRRVERATEGGSTYFFATPLSESALFPSWREWLTFFCDVHPQFTDGDALATTFDSIGAVLLTALLSGSRDEELISEVSAMPLAFVALVLGIADRLKIWWLDSIFELQELLQNSCGEFSTINSCLQHVKEQFWELCWTPGIETYLQVFRGRQQFGGKEDWWIDEEQTLSLTLTGSDSRRGSSHIV